MNAKLCRASDPITSFMAADLADEEWRKCPSFSHYSVSNTGKVRRDVKLYRVKPGLLAINRSPENYPRVALVSDDGSYCSRTIHSLVAEAFIGPRPEGQVVRHLNGDGGDNRPENLAYGSFKDNVADSIRHGTQVRGSRQHLAVLSEMQVRQLKLLRINTGMTMAKLGLLFEVTKSTVFDILKGRTWTHVEPVGDIRKRDLVQPHQQTRKTATGRRERLWAAL